MKNNLANAMNKQNGTIDEIKGSFFFAKFTFNIMKKRLNKLLIWYMEVLKMEVLIMTMCVFAYIALSIPRDKKEENIY